MILVADSGSTKTDWLLRPESSLSGEAVTQRFHTQGINPIHQSDAQILDILRGELLPQLREALTPTDNITPPEGNVPFTPPSLPLHSPFTPLEIEFYGSGVRPDQEARMEQLLREALTAIDSNVSFTSPSLLLHFPFTPLKIEAHSDLLGAARALCGDSEGLACILGTGANSCLYDGEHIVANTPPLGYILGDEGSGAVLGKRFLNALYKGHLGNKIKSDFEAEMQMTLTEVIDRVYRQPLPNRWLASLSPFIHSRLDDPAVEALVVGNFSDFIARNIEPYHRPDLPLQAVGSIAFFYKDQLCHAARKAGYAVGNILRSPLDGML